MGVYGKTWPELWRMCLFPKVARMAEHKFGNR